MTYQSEEKEDGGPAFPVSTSSRSETCGPYGHQDSGVTWQFPGMTIRDFFAAKAMQGMMANKWNTNYDEWAQHAYQMADSMLKARKES